MFAAMSDVPITHQGNLLPAKKQSFTLRCLPFLVRDTLKTQGQNTDDICNKNNPVRLG